MLWICLIRASRGALQYHFHCHVRGRFLLAFWLKDVREGGISSLAFCKSSYEYHEPGTKFLCKTISLCLATLIYLSLEKITKFLATQFCLFFY